MGANAERKSLIVNTLTVNIVSAEKEVWVGQARMVVAKTLEGEIGILPSHEPLLAMLDSGEVRVTSEEGKKIVAHAQGGFLSVENDTVTIVAREASLREQ